MENLDYSNLIDAIIVHWPLISGFIATAVVASGFQEKLHKWFGVQSPKVKLFITTVLSLVVPVIPAALHFVEISATTATGLSAVFFMTMTLAYRLIIQPTIAKWLAFKETEAEKTTDVPLVAPADDLLR